MKNKSVKGLKNFILALKEEHDNGTLGSWWNETKNITYDSVRDFYTFNGKEVTLDTVRNLVDYILANIDSLGVDELTAAANRAECKSVYLSARRFYMYETVEATDEGIEDSIKSDVVADEAPAEITTEAKVSEEAQEPVVQEEVVEAEKATPVAKQATKPAAKKAPARKTTTKK